MLGVARQGPLAPVACQLGKYDVLTITGTPGWETSKLTESSLLLMLVTVIAGSDFLGVNRASAAEGGAHGLCGPRWGPPGRSGAGRRGGSRAPRRSSTGPPGE